MELSPYAHVHAPHVIGYFRTIDTSFTLRALADGKTELKLRTTHQLNLNPTFYWRPLAALVVYLNNSRVLRDIAEKAKHSAD